MTAAREDASIEPVGEAPVLEVRGVRMVRLKRVRDPRGNLVAAEIGRGLPFPPRRCFVISDVPNHRVRGEHAHRALEQLLVCVKGRVSVMVDDGERREELLLDDPSLGLYIPPRVWAAQHGYSLDAVLMVFASAEYDATDYIRDYSEFLRLARP